MKYIIDIPEILLDRIKSAKCVPDMYGSDIVNTVICVRDATPYKERPHGKWEYVTHYGRRFRVCSVCKAEKEDDMATGWNFCQYCGSDNRKMGDK